MGSKYINGEYVVYIYVRITCIESDKEKFEPAFSGDGLLLRSSFALKNGLNFILI